MVNLISNENSAEGLFEANSPGFLNDDLPTAFD
jgi:hypothetical protein